MQDKKKHHILFSKDNSLKHRERIAKLLKKYPFSLNLRYKELELEALQRNRIDPDRLRLLTSYAVDRHYLKMKFKKLDRLYEKLWNSTTATISNERQQNNLPKESYQLVHNSRPTDYKPTAKKNLISEVTVKQDVKEQNKTMAPNKRDEKRADQGPHVIQFNDWLEGLKKSKKNEDLANEELKTTKIKNKKNKKKDKRKKKKLKKALLAQSMAAKEEKDIISETLAELMAKQGYTEKAIEMYNRLSLLFPEKNTYFARKIEDLNK